jgi:hypothetical protein
MTRHDVCSVLAEFFRDAFKNDPAGVGEWLAQGDNDPDEFIAKLDTLHPYKKDSGRTKT